MYAKYTIHRGFNCIVIKLFIYNRGELYVYGEDGSCRTYTVAESVYYADYYSNFEGCGALSKMGDYRNVGGIVLQTCEGNGARLVFCQ